MRACMGITVFGGGASYCGGSHNGIAARRQLRRMRSRGPFTISTSVAANGGAPVVGGVGSVPAPAQSTAVTDQNSLTVVPLGAPLPTIGGGCGGGDVPPLSRSSSKLIKRTSSDKTKKKHSSSHKHHHHHHHRDHHSGDKSGAEEGKEGSTRHHHRRRGSRGNVVDDDVSGVLSATPVVDANDGGAATVDASLDAIGGGGLSTIAGIDAADIYQQRAASRAHRLHHYDVDVAVAARNNVDSAHHQSHRHRHHPHQLVRCPECPIVLPRYLLESVVGRHGGGGLDHSPSSSASAGAYSALSAVCSAPQLPPPPSSLLMSDWVDPFDPYRDPWPVPISRRLKKNKGRRGADKGAGSGAKMTASEDALLHLQCGGGDDYVFYSPTPPPTTACPLPSAPPFQHTGGKVKGLFIGMAEGYSSSSPWGLGAEAVGPNKTDSGTATNKETANAANGLPLPSPILLQPSAVGVSRILSTLCYDLRLPFSEVCVLLDGDDEDVGDYFTANDTNNNKNAADEGEVDCDSEWCCESCDGDSCSCNSSSAASDAPQAGNRRERPSSSHNIRNNKNTTTNDSEGDGREGAHHQPHVAYVPPHFKGDSYRATNSLCSPPMPLGSKNDVEDGSAAALHVRVTIPPHQQLLPFLGSPMSPIVETVTNSNASTTAADRRLLLEAHLQWLSEGATEGDVLFLYYSGLCTVDGASPSSSSTFVVGGGSPSSSCAPQQHQQEDEVGRDGTLPPPSYYSLLSSRDFLDAIASRLPHGVRLTIVMDCVGLRCSSSSVAGSDRHHPHPHPHPHPHCALLPLPLTAVPSSAAHTSSSAPSASGTRGGAEVVMLSHISMYSSFGGDGSAPIDHSHSAHHHHGAFTDALCATFVSTSGLSHHSLVSAVRDRMALKVLAKRRMRQEENEKVQEEEEEEARRHHNHHRDSFDAASLPPTPLTSALAESPLPHVELSSNVGGDSAAKLLASKPFSFYYVPS